LTYQTKKRAALLRELNDIIAADRFPFSPRILMLKAIRAKLRPEPVREPLPHRSTTIHRERSLPEGAAPAVRP